MKEIRIFQTDDGKEPFLIWLDSIKDKVIRARIKRRIDRLYLGNEGDHKSVGDGVFELRIAFGSGYRFYYAKEKDVIYILLLGGDKKTQTKDIKQAKTYWSELKSRE
ncbi:type II toxin-antitoxin system RelE/ParE family toxin [Thiotrichales bacterium 19S11-10]|nr:type II toxin-antitoxin system RelE/ParE family toxin [Thiotrichales bacterium 19S11-10]